MKMFKRYNLHKLYINSTGGVMSHMQLTKTWKCLLYPKLQPTKCSITTKMEEESGRGKK